jgi:hypothetical protein
MNTGFYIQSIIGATDKRRPPAIDGFTAPLRGIGGFGFFSAFI